MRCNAEFLPRNSQSKRSNLELTIIQDIIFDLGGVIIGLDTQKTVDALAKLTGISDAEAQLIFRSAEEFKEYEIGKLTDEEFRNFIRSFSKEPLKDKEVDHAWNAMILDIPEHHFELLTHLSQTHRVHLLSNTNNIHLRYVESKLHESGKDSFKSYFYHQFYSHKMGMRKPNRDIYEAVLLQGDMKAHTTLFLDDNLDNVNAAKKLGINVYQVTQLADTARFFNER